MRKFKKCKHCGEEIREFVPSLHDCIVPYPHEIRRKLEQLWFVRGNNGPKHDRQDHYFIQRHVEGRRAEAERCCPTKECRREVDEIIKGVL